MIFMLPKPVLHRGRFMGIDVPLTKAERRVLLRAYDKWYAEEKARFKNVKPTHDFRLDKPKVLNSFNILGSPKFLNEIKDLRRPPL